MTKPADPRFIDLTGRVFGQLTVLAYASAVGSRRRHAWLCLCKCGKQTRVSGDNLRRGHSQTCGHSRFTARKTHGYGGHGKNLRTEYKIYHGILQRCYNPNNPAYKNYGGRGIKVCERWRNSVEAFIDDMGPRPSKAHSVERKDNNGNYEPDNCVWATQREQMQNTRVTPRLTFQNKTLTMAEWAAQFNMETHTLGTRLKRGWPVGRALTQPVQHRRVV